MTPLSINQCRDEYISGICGSWPSNKLSTTVQTTSQSFTKERPIDQPNGVWNLKSDRGIGEKRERDDGTTICCWCGGSHWGQGGQGERVLDYCREERRCVTSNRTSNQIVDDLLWWVVWGGQHAMTDRVTEDFWGEAGAGEGWWSPRWGICRSERTVRGSFKSVSVLRRCFD